MADDKETIIHKIKDSLRKKHPKWDEDKIVATAFKIYNSRVKAKESFKHKELDLTPKETRVFGFIRTTYPDLEGDVSPKETLDTWADQLNNYPDVGEFSGQGDIHHDRKDPHLASISEYAEVLPLDNGEHGLWVSDFVNEVHPDFQVIKEELENSMLPAYSVEFDARGMKGNIITPDCKLWGYAHASHPVDVHAVKTKEIKYADFEIIRKEGNNMEKVEKASPETGSKVNDKCITCGKEMKDGICEYCKSQRLETQGDKMVPDAKGVTAEIVPKEEKKEEETEEEKKKKKDKKDGKPEDKKEDQEHKEGDKSGDGSGSVGHKESVLENKEVSVEQKIEQEGMVKLKERIAVVVPSNKVLMKSKETEDEMMDEMPLKLKEVKESIDKMDWMSFKERMNEYTSLGTSPDMKWKEQFETYGLPMKTTMKMKCVDGKLKIVGGPEMKFKDILNTQTNPGAYTESPVEFADLFQPGLVETFNNQTGLLDAIRKVDIIPGGEYMGFTIKTARNVSRGIYTSNDVSVQTGDIAKLKVRQEIKVFRVGVSVADYTLYHARASLGDLFQLEINSSMADMMVSVGTELYVNSVGADGVTHLIGLEGVADTATFTTIYGKARTAANRLAPDAAGDTLTTVSGATTEANLRAGIDQLLINGSQLKDIRIIMSPKGKSYLFNLLKAQIYYTSAQQVATPTLGFDRYNNPTYDGVPIIVDPLCSSSTATIGSSTTVTYIIDVSEESGFVLGMSKPPQLTGLAKVSAATSAYVEMYCTTVYKKPRNIRMLNTITS